MSLPRSRGSTSARLARVRTATSVLPSLPMPALLPMRPKASSARNASEWRNSKNSSRSSASNCDGSLPSRTQGNHTMVAAVPPVANLEPTTASLVADAVTGLNDIILGKERQIRLCLACLLARGHLLIEDIPGVGKTTLAHALAASLGLVYQRIQFTSDLLPADIIGVSIFEAETGQF